MPPFDAFLDDLASGAPVPGGGSVAALQTAMAAALLEMVANLTIGRKRYLEVEDRVRAIRDAAGVHRARAQQLVDEDAAAYGDVAAAMAGPRESESARAERSARIQAALKGAAAPPLETMKLSGEVIRLAGELVRIGNPSAVSDVGTAAMAAFSGFEAARLNVEINVRAVQDAAWVSATQHELQSLGQPVEAVRRIMDLVNSIIRGTD